MKLTQYLEALPYPGRGIILGDDGDSLFAAYFIMGRSKSSQGRIMEPTPDGVRIRLFCGGGDERLLLYRPVRLYNNALIVTNGDQTDTVFDYLCRGQGFEEALNTREYEPDAPHYTPRVSGLLDTLTGRYKLSILRRTEGVCGRAYFEYDMRRAGHILHTYNGENADILPPFSGDPVSVDPPFGSPEDIWNALNPEYRVALYVSRWRNGEQLDSRIINRREDLV